MAQELKKALDEELNKGEAVEAVLKSTWLAQGATRQVHSVELPSEFLFIVLVTLLCCCKKKLYYYWHILGSPLNWDFSVSELLHWALALAVTTYSAGDTMRSREIETAESARPQK